MSAKQHKFVNKMPIARELDPVNLPLGARHLIEASAGTGKTFNITRLYVRLLIEKSYSVQQILVMTFTEAATEEIRGRVAQFIDEVLRDWDSDDAFVTQLQEKVDKDHARRLLESAKLSIDEASIFTIHGFCQRVITQFSVSMKQDPESKIIPQTEQLTMQAIADCIIAQNKDAKDFATLQSNNWHTPKKFYNAFRELLAYQGDISLLTPRQIWQEYVDRMNQHWQLMESTRFRLLNGIEGSAHWLEGLAKSKSNTAKIALEQDSAMAFLEQSILLNGDDALRLFEEMAVSEFVLNPFKSIVDDGLLKLFTGARPKKYPESWFTPLQALFDEIIEPIKQPLQGSSSSRLETRMQQSVGHAVALKVIAQVKLKVCQQMQQDSLHSYDDLINIVAKALAGENAEVIISHLLKQFPAALVDEFQDTDEAQYSIFSRLYAKGNTDTALIMIGDPKQAIYGFRGGDVFTYLQARHDADYLWSMDTNWRSTQDMVAAYNFVFANKIQNGHEQHEKSGSVFDYNIEYLPVLAAQGNKTAPTSLILENETYDQALQFVCTDAHIEDEKLTEPDVQRVQMITWMMNEIKVLLANGTINDGEGEKKIQEKDIAILVRAGFEADLIRQLFQQHGIASVYLSEKSPLFDSQQAQYLYYVLDAIFTGNDQRRCITALATGIFYQPDLDDNNHAAISTLIADRTHVQWQSVYKQNAKYRQMWQKQGIYALVLHLITHQFTISDEVESPERALTNYQHLAELLAQAAVMHTTQSSQLMWLTKQINHIDNIETAQLRLESDQALIKIVTQHKSKGLEYPVVFVPFANIARNSKVGQIVKYHDQNNNLVMQLGASDLAAVAMQQEAQAEDMRLLYVALTRPIYRCYIGMLSTENAKLSAIHRALQLPEVSFASVQNMDDADVNFADVMSANIKQATLDENTIAVRKASELGADLALQRHKDVAELKVQELTRSILQAWQLTSFTAITRLMHVTSADAEATSRLVREPELPETDSPSAGPFKSLGSDKQKSAIDPRNYDNSQSDELSTQMRFSMKKGATTGNILHDTLEWLSFSAPDFEAVLSKIRMRHTEFLGYDALLFNDWISDCLKAPLRAGNNALKNQTDTQISNLNLSLLPDSSTIKETEFYLPIEGLNCRALEQLLSEHRQRVATHFGFKAQAIKPISTSTIAGMLHGFIDLIFMVDEQYYVCDYKSTHLGDDYSCYQAAYIAENIQQHDYDLQYLLYAMALDRFLKQTLDQYEVKEHFGGVYYLYLRGMTANKDAFINGISPGVFYVPIEEAELARLTDMFSGNTTNSRGKL